MERKRQLGDAITLWAVLLVLYSAAPARTIYVDDDAPEGGDGTSWPAAYRFLQDALAEAELTQKPVEIRVAQGTYRSDQGAGRRLRERDASFELRPGMSVWGAFAGRGSVDPNEQSIALYKTILTGDLAENDVISEALLGETRSDNSRHVVRCAAGDIDVAAELCGCVIAGGWAGTCGAGLHIDRAKDVLIQNCVIENNRANEFGGGVYVVAADDVTILQCVFAGNVAGKAGGGVCLDRSHGRLIACEFIGNRADKQGGAVQLLDCRVALTNNRFRENAGPIGGAVVVDDGDNRFFNSTFVGNAATWGGAVATENDADLTFVRCHFRGNRALKFGGAIWSADAALSLTNSTVCGNFAGEGAGGIRTAQSHLVMTNCTTGGNRARVGAFLLNDAATPLEGRADISHCIISDEETPLWNGRSALAIQFTNLRGGPTAIDDLGGTQVWGPGNLDVAPHFANPGSWDINSTPDDPNDDVWIDGDYHLRSQAGRWDPTVETWVLDADSSTCIDAGDPAAVTRYEPSPSGCVLNLGAYGGTPEASKSRNNAATVSQTDEQKRTALLEELLQSVEGPSSEARILRRTDAGYLKSLLAPYSSRYVIPGVHGATPEETAIAFVTQWTDLLIRRTRAIDFHVTEVQSDEYGARVRFHETYAGLDVHWAGFVVHVDTADGVKFVLTDHMRDASTLESRPDLLVPSIGAMTAKRIGETIVSEAKSGRGYIGSEAKLVIYDPSISGHRGPQSLAWHMRLDPVHGHCGEYVLVDAHTGEILLRNPMCQQ